MGQYISVSTPANKIYMQNGALIRIFAFLGEKYKEKHRGVFVQSRDVVKLGIDFINKECGKRFKRTIRNLMNSTQGSTSYEIDYRCWKFHKCKSEKFFRVLFNALKNMEADTEIWAVFKELYYDISVYVPIEKRGSHIIPYPYKSALNQVQNNPQYTQEEKKCIARIVRAFPAYDKLYRE